MTVGSRHPFGMIRLLLVAILLLAFDAHAQSGRSNNGPSDWLNRMAAAVQSTNYEGTVLRLKDGSYQAIKVVHVVNDGVVRERLLIQEGNGLEIIRNGDDVQCILPDEKSVVIAKWDKTNTLFSSLPPAEINFGNEYDLSIVRQERVAGRKAALLAIRPHDEYRFGHRLWLDLETGFPLRTQLYSGDGTTIEEIKFADISINQDIAASSLASSYRTREYRWFAQPGRVVGQAVESDWTNKELPAGFQLLSSKLEQIPSSDVPVTHLLYGDGLAEVSVFVANKDAEKEAQRTTSGAQSTYSVDVGDFRITAIGEVPPKTVERIALSMQQP